MKTSLILFLILSQSILGQVQQEWVQRYNGSGNNIDRAISIATDNLGNILVSGYSVGSGTGSDFATIKYSSSGVELWSQRYNYSTDEPVALTTDELRNVYVTGISIGAGYDFVTLKYNSAGLQQWVQRYNGPGNGSDEVHSIFVDIQGNVYVAGTCLGTNGVGNYDCVTIKYNSTGDLQWVAYYDGVANGIDNASSVVVDSVGNVYMAGVSEGNGTNRDFITVKYNPTGIEQWAQRYSGANNGDDGALSVKLDDFANLYVLGFSIISGSGTDYALVKYNALGVQQWVQRYSYSNAADYPTAMSIDNLNNICVTGESPGSGTGLDFATVKYDTFGTEQWVQRYNGPAGNDIPTSIVVDNSGNIYVTGTSLGNGTSSDYTTIKYNSSGVQQWIQRYNGPGNGIDAANSIALDNSGNIYVTGQSMGIGTNSDFTTIKYSQLVSIVQTSNYIPFNYSIRQNYPNPFNPVTNINFDVREKGLVKLAVFNSIGQEIETLVNQQLSPGSYKVDWNAASHPSGVYYYKLTAGNFSETKKMILIK